jgi:CheY-specific phosphatase CheX
MTNAVIDDQAVAVLKLKLRELVRQSSLSRFKLHAAQDEATLRESEPDFRPGQILANRMAFILVSGDGLRISFKTHYNISTARNLAFRMFGESSPSRLSERQAVDYIKEYCNLVAGNIVTVCESLKIELGISLPMSTRGFYEIFSDYSEKRQPAIVFSDFWKLGAFADEVQCSVLLEITDSSLLAPLADYDPAALPEDDGEMDFL